MRNKIRIIALIVVLCGSCILPDNNCFVTSTVQAASSKTAQQKAREKQKKQRQKAAEKAKKAREKARKKQMASNAKNVNTRSNASMSSQQQEEVYQARVAEIQKHNDKVARYMTRDISHRLGLYGQVGYSTYFANKFTNNVSLPQGFEVDPIGGVGGGAGFVYQLRYKRFLFNTGLEFQMYDSHNKLMNGQDNSIYRSFSATPYPTTQFNYSFTDMQDYWQGGYMQLPLLFGMEFADNKLFFLAGAKLGYSVMGTSKLQTSLTTSMSDDEFITEMYDMPNHYLFNNKDLTPDPQKIKFGFNTAVYGEFGICLEQFIKNKEENKAGTRSKRQTPIEEFASRLRYRLSIFAEYGVLNVQTASNTNAVMNDIPAIFPVQSGNPMDLKWSSALATTSAKDAIVNPFLVGVKVAVMYELPRKKMKMLPMPTAPLPRMATMVVDDSEDKPVSGAVVNIYNVEKDKSYSKTTNKSGLIINRCPKGNYNICVSKMGYYASDTIQYALSRDLSDTLIIRIAPEPIPVVYTLAGYVLDMENKQPIEANVSFINNNDEHVFEGVCSTDGCFVTPLLKGEYALHVTSPGYMPLDQSIAFEQDSVYLYMQKIKEGIKVKIENLFFATNKTNILEESEASMNNLVNFLMENPSVSILITGHTDNVGSERSNQKLSQGRADAIRNRLILGGIDPERIQAEGKGMLEPVADNDTEEGRAQNRRVEFTIISTNGEDIQQIK